MTKPLVFNYGRFNDLRDAYNELLIDNQQLIADNRKLRKEVTELKQLNDGYVKIIAKNQETNNKLMASVQKQTGGDYISRADAIEAVCRDCTLERKDKCKAEGYCYEVQNLQSLPSADAVQGWIPVEEQPPVFPCLVCDANGNQPSVPLGIVTITDEEHGEWHIDGRLWDTKIFLKGEWCSQTGYGNRIIAWMPLPKPYKGGDDE